jgi:hypothetical protein
MCSLGRTEGLFRATGRIVKSLYDTVNPLRQCFFRIVAAATHRVSNITLHRRRNALTLFQSFAEAALAAGTAPKGLEQSFAASLEISPSMWSQIKSARPIGDKLARQIEQHCGKPAGWLDEEREAAGLSQAEQQFVALALKAWRSTNSAGRKALRAQLHEIAKGG